MKHTNAYKTNIVEQDGTLFYVGAADGGRRTLRAHIKKNKNRMFVDGKYIPKSHPLHKPGRYASFEEAAFKSLHNYSKSIAGELYLITNPAFEGWVKVGMAVDAQDRLRTYQTSSPFRDYEIQAFCKVKDRRVAEAKLHRRLAKYTENQGEWFKCSIETARDEMICVQSEEQY